MKTTILLCILFLSQSIFYGQSFNQEMTAANGGTMLLGKINKKGLSQEPYNTWFSKNQNTYTPEQTIIDSLKTALPTYTIKAFMGTWCGDSKREVPRFYRILEAAQFPLDRLSTIGVDRSRAHYKQSPGGEHEGMNIHRVPTFIVYKDGKEVNRIIERPVNSLEEDLLDIIKGTYQSNYSGVTLVHNAMETYGFKNLDNKRLRNKLSTVLKSYRELNSYAGILERTDHLDKAIAVARLNATLFPEASRAHSSLGSKLEASGALSKAVQSYKKALQLDPDNKELQGKIASFQ